MSGRGRDGELFGHSRREFGVSVIGYVIGFIVVLFVLDLIGMVQQQPRQAFVLVIIVPLVPFLILLAFAGRIGTVRGPAGIEITFEEADRESAHDGAHPAPDRRTVLKLGAFAAAVGTIWGVISQRRSVTSLIERWLSDGRDGTDSGSDGSPTLTTTTTVAETTTSTDSGTERSTDASLEIDYGDQTYGQHDYGG
jgi:hypothetical protein